MTERPQKKWHLSLTGYAVVLVLFWTASTFLMLEWIVHAHKQNSLQDAIHNARSAFDKDLLYRQWASMHEGVYVPVTDKTLPNPYLSHVQERDIVTPSGKRLTLMNPAYMIRQVQELGVERYGLKGHITSLRPINPNNAPDPWERKTLESFEKNPTEVTSREELDGQAYFRLMKPMLVEKKCLTCHASQGYKEGDIRGGISISVPMAPLIAIANKHVTHAVWGYSVLWILGITGIGLGYRNIKRRINDFKLAEEALRESELKYRTLVENLPQKIFYKNRDSVYVSCNENLARDLGISPAEIAGKTDDDFFPKEIAEKYKYDDQRIMDSGQIEEVEETYIKDGHEYTIQTVKTPIVDGGGNVVGVLGIFWDITERKRIEESLRRAHTELKQIFSAAVPLCVIDKNRTMIRVNDSFRSFFGLTEGDVVGKNCYDILHNPKCNTPDCMLQQILNGVEYAGCEMNKQLAGGNSISCAVTAIPFKGVDGEIIGVVENFTDITQSKQAEKALRESEERFRLMYEQSPLGYQALDENRCFIEVNPTWLDLLGYERDEVIGHPFREFLIPEQKPLFDERFPKFQKAGRILGADFRMVRKDGDVIDVDIDGKVAYNPDGSFKQTHCVLRDVTEAKQVEEQLKHYREDLEQMVALRTRELTAVNKELESFAYSVSHDLRTPLRGIDGFSRALQEEYADSFDDTGKDYLRRVRAASQRMAQLIEDILKLSRLTRCELRHERVDLGVLAEKIAKGLKAADPDRKVRFVIAPEAAVTGDSSLLEVVLENLLGNAWKFTSNHEQACIEFGVKEENGEKVYYVRDDGVGFDMAYADKLFGVFQRLHGQKEFAGTGIGLATVQRIMNRHDGRIWAESAVGKGATFYFTL